MSINTDVIFYFNKIKFCHLSFRINLSLDLFPNEDNEEFKDGMLTGIKIIC